MGTGESLNEVALGIEWPDGKERFARFREAVSADPRAVVRGAGHLRGHLLPHRQGHDLRPPGAAGADLPGRLGPGRDPLRRASGRRLHHHVGQGPRALHRHAAAGGARGRREGRPRRGRPRHDDRGQGLLRPRPRRGHGGDPLLGRARPDPGAEGRRRGPGRDAAPGRRAARSSRPRAASSSPPTPTSTSRRSRPTSTSASTTSSSTRPARTRRSSSGSTAPRSCPACGPSPPPWRPRQARLPCACPETPTAPAGLRTGQGLSPHHGRLNLPRMLCGRSRPGDFNACS